VNDSANNVNSSRITFRTDTTDPIVTLISAVSPTYTYNVTDASNIENCSLLLNGAVVATDTSVSSRVTETITYTPVPGTYVCLISCADSYSNVGNSNTTNIVVSSTGLSFISGRGGGFYDILELIEEKEKYYDLVFECPYIYEDDSNCGEWSECEIYYDLEDIMEDRVFLNKFRTRKCPFLDNSSKHDVERKGCYVKTKNYFKRQERNNKKYVEIYDKKVNKTEEESTIYDYCFDYINESIPDDISELNVSFEVVETNGNKTIIVAINFTTPGYDKDTYDPGIITQKEVGSGDYLLISRADTVTDDELDVQILLDETNYFPSCFNGIKDLEEDEVDCEYSGINCPVCGEGDLFIEKSMLVFWIIFWFIFLLFILLLILLLIILLKEREEEKKRGRERRKKRLEDEKRMREGNMKRLGDEKKLGEKEEMRLIKDGV
jgi:hypothetical protein